MGELGKLPGDFFCAKIEVLCYVARLTDSDFIFSP